MLGSDAELGEYADARGWAVGADGVVAFGGGDTLLRLSSNFLTDSELCGNDFCTFTSSKVDA